MNLFTSKECTANCAAAGAAKTRMPIPKMFLLAARCSGSAMDAEENDGTIPIE